MPYRYHGNMPVLSRMHRLYSSWSYSCTTGYTSTIFPAGSSHLSRSQLSCSWYCPIWECLFIIYTYEVSVNSTNNKKRMTAYLHGGGFPAFFYHIGYVLGARRQGTPLRCCGSSGGALAAWVLGHRDVSFEAVCAAAHLTKSQHSFAFLDTYVVCFMDHIKQTCGPFDPGLYAGAYTTPIGSLTATLTHTESGVRASCFIPILSGGLSMCGRIDGCLSVWYDKPLDAEYSITPPRSPFFLLPLSSHTVYYSRGYEDGTRGFPANKAVTAEP